MKGWEKCLLCLGSFSSLERYCDHDCFHTNDIDHINDYLYWFGKNNPRKAMKLRERLIKLGIKGTYLHV